MGDDQAPNRMNLDLNLGPFRPATPPAENDSTSDLLSVDLENWISSTNRLRREASSRMRVRNHWRSIQGQVPMPIPLETSRSTGEGSGPAQPIKTCENNNSNNNPILVDDNGDNMSGRKEDDEKPDQGSFFDCNICLELSINPVVTCCGHLFCWTCIYQWLHFHSDAKECPVCKGEVTIKTVTPIYGRGMASHHLEEDPTLKIPARPQAHRVESWRQTIERNAFTFPVEEMIRRLGNRYDLTRDLVQVQMHERNNNNEHAPLLDRILTSRALRREHNNLQPNEAVDLTERSATNFNSDDERRLVHLMLRRQQAHLATNSQPSLINNYTERERVRRRIFRATHNLNVTSSAERNQEHHHPLSGEDRDSVSSIAAVIQSGSQMVDNAMEIDSNVSISTSSSRRRQDASRVSDMDSGDSRPPTRRRRIN